MKEGDVFEVIKDWDIDISHSERSNTWRRNTYKVKGNYGLFTEPNTFRVGAIGVETQFPFYKYPEYFRKVDEKKAIH